jgi:rubrerythrin
MIQGANSRRVEENMGTITEEQKRQLLILQQDEINSHLTYARLAKVVKDANNSNVIKRISDDELKHYQIWKSYTQQDIKPKQSKVRFFFWVSKLFGLTFGIRLMELGEKKRRRLTTNLRRAFLRLHRCWPMKSGMKMS